MASCMGSKKGNITLCFIQTDSEHNVPPDVLVTLEELEELAERGDRNALAALQSWSDLVNSALASLQKGGRGAVLAATSTQLRVGSLAVELGAVDNHRDILWTNASLRNATSSESASAQFALESLKKTLDRFGSSGTLLHLA